MLEAVALYGMASRRWLVPEREYTPKLTGGVATQLFDRFPLYSKGVDTYRFEYGVFLLNKNIELVSSVPRSVGPKLNQTPS